MGLKGLAEGIIIQSMEDLWNESLREECIAFFKGGDFRTCAELAGMNLSEQVKLLSLVKSIIDEQNRKRKEEKAKGGWRKDRKTGQGWGWGNSASVLNH